MKEEINKTKAAIYYDCWRLTERNEQIVGKNNDKYITLEQLNDILKQACPANCGFDETFGFVPEAGCPVHD